MKLLKLNLLSLVLLLLVTSCQKDESFTQEEANYSIDLNLANETDWQMADEVLAVINTHRASLNLQPLQRDQQYASAYAVEHTLYMIEKAEINHHNFGVRNEGLRSKGAVSVAENVAYERETWWLLLHTAFLQKLKLDFPFYFQAFALFLRELIKLGNGNFKTF